MEWLFGKRDPNVESLREEIVTLRRERDEARAGEQAVTQQKADFFREFERLRNLLAQSRQDRDRLLHDAMIGETCRELLKERGCTSNERVVHVPTLIAEFLDGKDAEIKRLETLTQPEGDESEAQMTRAWVAVHGTLREVGLESFFPTPMCCCARERAQQFIRHLAAEVERLSADRDLFLNGVEQAWSIIANAHGGDWGLASEDWLQAAAAWRDLLWQSALAHCTPCGPMAPLPHVTPADVGGGDARESVDAT